MNDENTRRELIMDILYHDTGEYVEVLQKAKFNDDVEVVHYATTAMVELQKDYEEKTARRRRAWEENKDSEERLFSYAEVLEDYVDSGLLEGNIKRSRQEELCGLQEQILELVKGTQEEKAELYRKLFDNFIELGRLPDARNCADYVMSRWPDLEEGYLMRIRLAVEDRNGVEIQQILGTMKENKIYLSAEARKIVEFWKEDHEEQQ